MSQSLNGATRLYQGARGLFFYAELSSPGERGTRGLSQLIPFGSELASKVRFAAFKTIF